MAERIISEELEQWCNEVKTELEASYTAFSDDQPWRQSGMLGPESRWTALRKPVADSIQASGTLLDMGCANGYLLECVMNWVSERGISIEPFGLDISGRLVDLAKKRLPRYSEHFFVGNCFSWLPPRRFDYVSTMWDMLPERYEKEYLDFILSNHLTDNGKLLVLRTGEHGEPELWLQQRLHGYGMIAEQFNNGYDPVRDRQASVAVIPRKI